MGHRKIIWESYGPYYVNIPGGCIDQLNINYSFTFQGENYSGSLGSSAIMLPESNQSNITNFIVNGVPLVWSGSAWESLGNVQTICCIEDCKCYDITVSFDSDWNGSSFAKLVINATYSHEMQGEPGSPCYNEPSE
ncbi:MAG: hypothetical protein KDC92_04630 [Bacteroidetes bacterium]|nr:hypothetical protein [Bacteroidota bacterium]